MWRVVITYRNMEMTVERISFYFDRRDLLSLKIGLSFIRAAVACAIHEITSGFEPSSETTASIHFIFVKVPGFFHFSSMWMPLALFIISLVLSAPISILYLVQVLSRLSTTASGPCSSSARAPLSWQTADW